MSCSGGRGHDRELGQSAHRPGGARRRRVLQPPGEYRSGAPRPAGARTPRSRVYDLRVTELGRWGQIQDPRCGLGVSPHAGAGAKAGASPDAREEGGQGARRGRPGREATEIADPRGDDLEQRRVCSALIQA